MFKEHFAFPLGIGDVLVDSWELKSGYIFYHWMDKQKIQLMREEPFILMVFRHQ